MTVPEGSLLDLLDWKRRVFELYADARATASAGSPRAAWDAWRAARDELFRTHSQSPIPEDERQAYPGVSYFDHDPAARVAADLEPAEHETLEIGASDGGAYVFTRFAVARFELRGEPLRLDVYWLDAYGGGLFLPFRDATAGRESYGAGRYLLDTVKGSDLGTTDDDRLVLDFNFAYNPSCSYDPRWSCPLAPPANRLAVEVRAGERLTGGP
ncbi:MAG TPA: DUF1684 domain-containing protein [Actinomycetota bacterium]